MGKTFSVYIKDDELAEEIEHMIEEGRFHNQAHFFSEAAESLIDDENDRDVLV